MSPLTLQYLFTDLWTSPVLSIDNFKYYLIIVDHFTRYTWFYPLKLKSHVKETFIQYKSLVENIFQTKIGTLFSDNGGKFIALRTFLADCGIAHLTTPPHTPEHNGLSERRHRHIVETGLSLFFLMSPSTHLLVLWLIHSCLSYKLNAHTCSILKITISTSFQHHNKLF